MFDIQIFKWHYVQRQVVSPEMESAVITHTAVECSLTTQQTSANALKLECGSEARPGPAVLVSRNKASDWLDAR